MDVRIYCKIDHSKFQGQKSLIHGTEMGNTTFMLCDSLESNYCKALCNVTDELTNLINHRDWIPNGGPDM
jgi:hypothetical protein